MTLSTTIESTPTITVTIQEDQSTHMESNIEKTTPTNLEDDIVPNEEEYHHMPITTTTDDNQPTATTTDKTLSQSTLVSSEYDIQGEEEEEEEVGTTTTQLHNDTVVVATQEIEPSDVQQQQQQIEEDVEEQEILRQEQQQGMYTTAVTVDAVDGDDEQYEEEEEEVEETSSDVNVTQQQQQQQTSSSNHHHHRNSTIGEEHEEEETEQEKERKRREREEKEENEKKLRRARERKQVEMEILSTERDYVNNLDMCYQHFIKPIKESLNSGRPILSQDDYETMFVDLETIVPVNREMLKSLQAFFQREKEDEERRQRGETVVVDPKADTLGTIFLRMTPYLKSYTTFCNKYEAIFKLIEERKGNKKVFRKFLESKEYQPEVNFQALVAFLIRPVQRIPRYSLLLRELIKNTEQDHPDLAKLNEANTNVVKLANYVNDKLKEAMNQEKCIFIENIVEGLNFELIQASRKFVKEGVLGYISSKNGIQSRYVFLFSDLFVTTKSKASIIEYQNNDSTGTNAPNFDNPDAALASAHSSTSSSNSDLSTDAPDEERKRDSKSNKNKTKFLLRSAVSLQNVPLVWVNDMPNGFVIQNAFQLVTPKKTYTFFAKDEQYKKEWLVSLNKQLDLLHANPLLQGKPKAEMTIPEDSKLHLFTCKKTIEDFKESTGDISIEITAAAAVANNRESGDTPSSPAITKLKVARTRRHSSVDRVESPKSPRGKKGFTTFLKNLTKKKEKVKKITDGEIMVVSDSEDEEEESSKDMLPWMSDYYVRLLEKQTHNNFINILGSIASDMKPVISEMQNIDQMDQIIINPLFGLKIKTTRDYRLSVCDELQSKMEALNPSLVPTPLLVRESLHAKSKTHSSLTYQEGSLDEFSEFVKSYKEKTGNASNIDSSEADADNAGGTKEKRRRSLFFFAKK